MNYIALTKKSYNVFKVSMSQKLLASAIQICSSDNE